MKPKQSIIEGATFRFLEGTKAGTEMDVAVERKIVLGRDPECDVCLNERSVSRQHCAITVTAEGVFMNDLGSSNGTHVNSTRVREARIEDQDKIRVGSSVILVSIHYPKDVTQVDYGSGALSEEKSFAVGVKPGRKPGPVKGDLFSLSLEKLLNQFVANGTGGILKINRNEVEGQITIHNGCVIDANLGHIRGDKAFFRMLGWNGGTYEMSKHPDGISMEDITLTIAPDMVTHIEEGKRQLAELDKILKGLPSLELRLKTPMEPPLTDLKPKFLSILQLIHNEKSIWTVLDKSEYLDLETAQMILILIQRKYVESSRFSKPSRPTQKGP